MFPYSERLFQSNSDLTRSKKVRINGLHKNLLFLKVLFSLCLRLLWVFLHLRCLRNHQCRFWPSSLLWPWSRQQHLAGLCARSSREVTGRVADRWWSPRTAAEPKEKFLYTLTYQVKRLLNPYPESTGTGDSQWLEGWLSQLVSLRRSLYK